MPKLTVLIPCKNEQLNIRECIMSVLPFADEVLVADSGSTDGTLRIVDEIGGCRIIEREYVNPSDFKNWALEHARHEWVLTLDADERVTPDLGREIRELLEANPQHDAYQVHRDHYFLGYRIRHCGWDHHRIIRLLRRSACRYDDRRVHENIDLPAERVGNLEHRLEHYTAWDVDSFVGKQNRYSTWAAEDMHDRGRSHGLNKILLRGPLRFLQLYFLRGGVLDGVPGLIVCGIMAHYAFLKSAKLWALDHVESHPLGSLPKSEKTWQPATIPISSATRYSKPARLAA